MQRRRCCQLFRKFKLAEMESAVRHQLEDVEEQMRIELEARLSALTAEIETPEVSVEEGEAFDVPET